MLVGAEEHVPARDRRVAVVHSQRLEPAVDHAPASFRRGRDHRHLEAQRLSEGKAERGVVGVHQQVRPGLDLAGPVVQVVGAGPARRGDVAADVVVGAAQQGHRLGHLLGPTAPVGVADDVALVAHDAADVQPPGPCELGQTTGVLGPAPAAGESDVDVDEHLGPGVCGHLDRLGGVDRHGHAGVTAVDQVAQAWGVERLVGQQQVVAQPGVGHALHLAQGRAAEGLVAPELGHPARQLRRLERLHVRPESATRPGGGHGGDVGVERVDVDDERRCGQVADLHRPDGTRSWSGTGASRTAGSGRPDRG